MYFLRVLLCLSLFGALSPAQQRAKNVILFLGDAGGIPTLNGASIHGYGAPQKLFVQHMPHIALSDTSASTSWVTDSAAGMTAIVTGQKVPSGVLSQAPDGTPLKTILEYAEEHGLSTGVVSNSPMSDATPAACYSHVAARKMTGEIFAQVWKPRFGDGVDVILGPGRKAIAAGVKELGFDLDTQLKSSGRPVYESFAAIPADAKRAVVLLDSADFSLEEAADKAIAILSKNPKGFFLMVENDLHTDNPKRGLDRAVAFDKYIEKTAKSASKDTLVIFTADHSFDFRIRSGKRGEPLTLPSTSKPTPAVAEAEAKTNARVNGTHTGEEVLVAAQGPGSEKVRGFLPNTELFQIMLSAFKWKP